MTITMYPYGFKIRSKADVECFLHQVESHDFYSGSGEWYWHSHTHDYCLNVKARRVCSRPMSERGNIFSPYVQVMDAASTIWNTRKYINQQLFSE